MVERDRHGADLTVHPHVRGDHGGTRSAWGRSHGSPPRAWGSSLDADRLICRHRFTPTCVGIMPLKTGRHDAPTVHPHVRGDHEDAADFCMCHTGSPPRAWGSLLAFLDHVVRTRFTPTCVGIMSPRMHQGQSPSVHPHVRGDHITTIAASAHAIGSPPRAWGSCARIAAVGEVERFTPTCVGIMEQRVPRTSFTSVHPHVRGDHSLVSASG